MPIPQPRPDETTDDFMQRCMSNGVMLLDFPDPSQRFAICQQQVRNESEASNVVNIEQKQYSNAIQTRPNTGGGKAV
jgi:hypothetical protein